MPASYCVRARASAKSWATAANEAYADLEGSATATGVDERGFRKGAVETVLLSISAEYLLYFAGNIKSIPVPSATTIVQ